MFVSNSFPDSRASNFVLALRLPCAANKDLRDSLPVLHDDLRLPSVMLPPQWEHDQRGCQKVHPAVAMPVAAVLVMVATTGLTHSGKS